MSGLGAPMGIDVTANTSQGEQGLARVNQQLATTEQRCRKATLAARDLNQEMGKQFRQGAQAARGTAAAGGLSQVGAGVGMGGTMGMMATIAGVGATMFQIVKRFTDLAEESAKRRLDFEEKITDAAEKAKDARSASAERGMGQEQAYREAVYKGGPKAIERADAMIQAGVDPTTAYQAASASQNAAAIYGFDRVKQLLLTIARRGGNVGEAAKKLQDRPWMLERKDDSGESGGTPGGQDDTDLAGDLMGLRPNQRPAWGDYNIRVDPFLQQAEKNRKIRGQTALADRTNAANGAANDKATRDLNMARDPEGVLKGDAIAVIDKSLAKLDRLADTQDGLSKVIADVFSPGGSFETQLVRAMRDRNRALDGDR